MILGYYARKDAEVRAIAHTGLSEKARELMPLVDAETASSMRVAILAGPGHGLRDLVLSAYRRGTKVVACA